jgi:hypothetical protein
VRARVSEKREVAKGTLLVLFDLLGDSCATSSPAI